MIDDSDQMAWLHSDQRQAARSAALLSLLKAFGGDINPDGSPKYNPRGLYGAAHDYVSHGNTDPGGVLGFYLENSEVYS